jgi:hypothetical protein
MRGPCPKHQVLAATERVPVYVGNVIPVVHRPTIYALFVPSHFPDSEPRFLALAAEVKVRSSRTSSSGAEKVDGSPNASWPGEDSTRAQFITFIPHNGTYIHLACNLRAGR